MTKVTLWGKVIPLWFVVVLTIPLTIGVVLAAVTVQTTNYTSIGGEVVNVSEKLSCAGMGIDVEDDTLSAAGGTFGAAVEMTADGAVANTATTQGHYIYLYKLQVVTLDAGKVYKAQLFMDGESQGSCYVTQHATDPLTSHHAHLTYDIGTSLASAVFEIEVKEVLS